MNIKQITAIFNAIGIEGMDNSQWAIICTTEGQTSDKVLGTKEVYHMQSASYLVIWDNGESLYVRNTINLVLTKDEYKVLTNGKDEVILIKIYDI